MRRTGTCALSLLTVISCCVLLCRCGPVEGDPALTANTRVQLMDWHISGFWVINCPVAWVRVINYNPVPIKNVLIRYQTYDADGVPLDVDNFVIDGTVGPGETRNFIELYFGLVSLYTERLSIKLISVQRDQ